MDIVLFLTYVIDTSEKMANKNKLSELSMGMSNDYKEAIDHGATFIRIGSSIKIESDYYAYYNASADINKIVNDNIIDKPKADALTKSLIQLITNIRNKVITIDDIDIVLKSKKPYFSEPKIIKFNID